MSCAVHGVSFFAFQDSYSRTKSLLKAHAEEHKRLAEALLKYETLTAQEVKQVIANKPLDRTI